MAGIATSIEKLTEPWTVARNRFFEDLDDDERKLFENATLENIFYSASASYKVHEENSRFAIARRKIMPLLEKVESYGRAVDVLSQASPTVLCPLWGSLRVVLQMALNHGKYYDSLLKMLERIGENLPQFRIYERLFTSHQRLLHCLADAYLDIINFCCKVRKVFQNIAKMSAITRTVVSKERWKSFKTEFEVYIENFRKHQQRVADEALIAHMIESKESRELILSDRTLQQRSADLQELFRMRAILSTYDYMLAHRRVRETRHEGTGEWLLGHPNFKRWRESEVSTKLCCYGIPGCGKTVLASTVIDELMSASAGSHRVIFHYCDYAIHETLVPSKIVGGLARQLFDHQAFPDEVVEQLRPYLSNGFMLPNDLLWSILEIGLKVVKHTVIVIDGIDELNPASQERLLDGLERLQDIPSLIIRVILFSRRGDRAIEQLIKSIDTIEISFAENSGDLGAFVRAEIRDRIARKRLILSDPRLEDEIKERLVKEAQDMFLWAKLQIDELCFAPNDHAIRTALSCLPRSLIETYDRIIGRIQLSAGGVEKIDLASRVFMWIVCVRRPLTIDELKEAVAIYPDDRCLQRDRITTDDLAVTDACSNLIVVSSQDRTVRLAHQTVLQYLLSDGSEHEHALPDRTPAKMRRLNFSRDDAREMVSKACIAYVRFSDFESQLVQDSRHTISMKSEQFGLPMWRRLQLCTNDTKIIPLIGSARTVWNRATSGVQETKTIIQLPATAPDLTQTYTMLDYIAEHWPWHVNISPNQSSSVYQDLFFTGGVPERFQTWRHYRQTLPEDAPRDYAVFAYATEHDLAGIVRNSTRRKEYWDFNRKHGMDPLSRALQADAKEMALSWIDWLNSTGRQAADHDRVSYIRQAAHMSSHDCLKAILGKDYSQVAPAIFLNLDLTRYSESALKRLVRRILPDYFLSREWPAAYDYYNYGKLEHNDLRKAKDLPSIFASVKGDWSEFRKIAILADAIYILMDTCNYQPVRLYWLEREISLGFARCARTRSDSFFDALYPPSCSQGDFFRFLGSYQDDVFQDVDFESLNWLEEKFYHNTALREVFSSCTGNMPMLKRRGAFLPGDLSGDLDS